MASALALPVAPDLQFGLITASPSKGAARRQVEQADRLGLDSLWVGDHIAFPLPILDPFLQLAQLAAFSDRLILGTSVYLLPLRHPVHVAKQVATLDRLTGGRLVFGVGVGGEFAGEYAACGVPLAERGARMSEAIPLVRSLVRGEATTGTGAHFPFPETQLLPPAEQSGGPPIWCGGRAPAALRRMGRMADGWVSYVTTPDRYREGLETIAAAAEKRGRTIEQFGTGHLLFAWTADRYDDALDVATENLSARYAMDFRSAAKRYAALGSPSDVAGRIAEFRDAGVRHVILDFVGPVEERDVQLQRFADEVRPLL